MGLFNSGKNDKVEKVNKYERNYNVPSNSSHRRSSKHRSHNQGEAGVRAMSQPPIMRVAPNYYSGVNVTTNINITNESKYNVTNAISNNTI